MPINIYQSGQPVAHKALVYQSGQWVECEVRRRAGGAWEDIYVQSSGGGGPQELLLLPAAAIGTFWTSPANITTPGPLARTSTSIAGNSSYDFTLRAQDFDLASQLPAGCTLLGVAVEVAHYAEYADYIQIEEVKLGPLSGDPAQAGPVVPTTLATGVIGGPTDLWGKAANWLRDQLREASFEVRLKYVNTTGKSFQRSHVWVDTVKLHVWYE